VKHVDRNHIYQNPIINANNATISGINYEIEEKDIKEYSYERPEMKLGEVVNIVSAEEYQKFLNSIDEKKEQIIHYMDNKFNNYEQYRDQVKEFLKHLKQLKNIQDHQSHIAQEVFNINISGKEYVMRYRSSPGSVGNYLIGTSYIEGEKHFEQIIAASIEEGVTIAEKIPGRQLNKLSPEDIANIKDEQISEAFSSLLIAYKRDLGMENKSKNILYDEQEGFGFIDFVRSFSHVNETKIKNEHESLVDCYFLPLFNGLVNLSAASYDWKPKTKEAIENNVLGYKKQLETIRRIYPIIIDKLTGKEEAIKIINERVISDIAYYEQKIRESQDIEWINKTLEENNIENDDQKDRWPSSMITI